MSDSDESDWSTDDESGEEEEAEVDLTAPKPIKLKTPVWDAKFHPSERLVVAGDLNGIIRAWSFDDEGSSKLIQVIISLRIKEKILKWRLLIFGNQNRAPSHGQTIQARNPNSFANVKVQIVAWEKYPENWK